MRVVNVRTEMCTHYVGRGTAPNGMWTGLGNPIKLHEEFERLGVLAGFEDWVRHDPGRVAAEYRRRIYALPEHAVLGCWCKPKPCHGDVIIAIWKEMHHDPRER